MLTEANGLLYMRARYYSPDLMRFINEDIVTGDISNSNSLNRYSYVEGNPVAMVDPFGLCGRKSISYDDKNVFDSDMYVLYTNEWSIQAVSNGLMWKHLGYDVHYINLNKEARKNQTKAIKEADMELAKEFIYQWNNVIPQDVAGIAVFSHGSERMLQFVDGSSYNAITTNGLNKSGDSVAGSFSDLITKSVDDLYLMSCNTGLVDIVGHTCEEDNSGKVIEIHDGTNPAEWMSLKIDGIVHAWDGSVAYSELVYPTFCSIPIMTYPLPRISNKQESFESLESKGHIEVRDPIGEVLYQNGMWIH